MRKSFDAIDREAECESIALKKLNELACRLPNTRKDRKAVYNTCKKKLIQAR